MKKERYLVTISDDPRQAAEGEKELKKLKEKGGKIINTRLINLGTTVVYTVEIKA